ncbi:MAG: response regulator [Gammaproteobacteria bacterium]
MKIQVRLLLLMLAKTTFAMLIALLVTSHITLENLEEASNEKLSMALEARDHALDRWVHNLQGQITLFSMVPTTGKLLGELGEEFHHLGGNAQVLLQQNYLLSNRDNPQAQKPASIETYDKINRAAEVFFSRSREIYDWDDMLLIDPQGNVVYSLKKEPDFATNLITGPWRNTGLARAVTPLLQAPIPKQFGFSGFSKYEPSNMKPAGFVAVTVFDEEKQQFLGVLAVQLPISQMSELMNDKTGLGETGEVIVIDKDGWMLTDSRFIKESTILNLQINSKPSEMVLAGKTDTLITPDYRGIEILAMFKPFTPFPASLGDKVVWGIIAKIEYSEILHEYYYLRQILLLTMAVLVLLAVSLGIWGGRTVTKPLIRITNALTRLANGEQVDVPELHRSDEIGAIAKAAETFHAIVQQVESEHWLSENVATLTAAVSNENTISKAAEQVLHLLCNSLAVPVGAIYLSNGYAYQRVSSYGLARSNQADTNFEPGIGLLGQCALSNQAIVLSPVPSGLTIISTGLAEFAPQELVIYPIEHKGEVLAVVELAATTPLQPKQHAFLNAISTELGLHFANLQAAEHNTLLLAETSKQAIELRTSSNYARSLIEASLDPLVTIDVNGKIMDVNAATENVTGVERGKLIGSDFCDYFIEPDVARNGYRQAFSKGFVTDYPLAIRHVNGNIIDVLYNASVFLDSEGEVAGIFAAARDITEKKKAEQKMLEQQESLLRSNEEMKTLSEEMRSQSEEMKSQNEELKSSQEELRAQQDETILKNQLLETQSLQLKKMVAEAKEKAQELQRTNQYKSEFLANMSHELRTPLNSILILSKSLAENDERNLSLDQVESASVISESGTQLLTLINDILDLSKIEAGKLELDNELFPVHSMVTYLQRVFLPQSEKRHLTFSIEVDANLPESIYSDRQRLTQVVSNLLTNAIKFTDSGSVKVVFGKVDEDLQIEVIDTGIGIPPDKLDHIFGAFQQLDGSTSRKYGGSGLGLAISRNLAHLLGGEITVTSAVGQGSRFAIRLNKVLASSEIKAGAQLAAPNPSVTVESALPYGGNILLVEDDTRLLAILGRMISAFGYTPIAVESAEQGLSALSNTSFTGIFLDLGLPEMNGMDMLKQLKSNQATAAIPVFIMSGAEDTGEAKTVGALGFLKKPVTRDIIINALKTMTQQAAVRQILLIEDNPIDSKFVENLLNECGINIVVAATGTAALHLLQTQHFAAVILDLQLPDMSGFEWLNQAHDNLNPPPIIIYSARELTENEVFDLKGVTESIVTKDALSDRLREEVLHALQGIAQPAVMLNSEQQSGKKLLLVDDDARNLFALTKVLKSKGFDIEVAPDAIQALELLAQNAFDVLLTDIMMPEIDGYELIRRVRALGYNQLPIVAITAKAMQGDGELCLQAGANAYLAKPVDVDDLIGLIEQLS